MMPRLCYGICKTYLYILQQPSHIPVHPCISPPVHVWWYRLRYYRLFVPEAIPRAVRRSNDMLGLMLQQHDGPVAWGNTNAKPSDFKTVRHTYTYT